MDIDWHEVFEYRDGTLIYKERPREHFATEQGWKIANARCVGKVAGTPDSTRGGLKVHVYPKVLWVHQIVWEMHYGLVPEGMQIDHIDRDRGNNRIENLRACTAMQNTWNRGHKKDSKLPKNVYLRGLNRHGKPTKSKYKVRVSAHGKMYYAGNYSDLELAELVAHELREKIHGEFACHD